MPNATCEVCDVPHATCDMPRTTAYYIQGKHKTKQKTKQKTTTMSVPLLDYPVCTLLGTIVNYVESNKDLHSFILTCKEFANYAKLKRMHISVDLYDGDKKKTALTASIFSYFKRLRAFSKRLSIF